MSLAAFFSLAQFATVAVVAFVAGHKAQLAALARAAEALGPDFEALLGQVRDRAKAKRTDTPPPAR